MVNLRRIIPDGRSCRNLRECMTEFGAQGLELDATLLAWGTDLVSQASRPLVTCKGAWL